MKTPITEMLDIELPILAFSHCRDVVAEVTRAGGMGVLGATGHTPDHLAVDLKWIQEQVNGKPFGVDLLFPMTHDTEREDHSDPVPTEHYDFVDQLLERHGLEPLRRGVRADDSEGEPGRMSEIGMTALTDPEKLATGLLDVAFDHGIALIASALGPPPAFMVDGAKANDVRVAALAGKAKHAKRHVEAGADLVVVQGYEAGGHTGEIATMVLVPEVVDAIAPVPVLAAGGIGRGRQIAASMTLGAAGVWCGSVWLTTTEAETHPVVKEKFLAAGSDQTVRSRARTGKPARQLVSSWTDAWNAPDAPNTLAIPTQYRISEPALARANHAAQAGNEAARQMSTYFVGQIVGSMNKVKPARQVVFEMVEELIEAIESVSKQLES